MILKKGNILIAKPHKPSTKTYNKAVVFIAEYSAKGSIGFILNTPSGYKIKDLLPEINSDFNIYIGGEEESGSLYFLHSVPNLIQNSVKICDNVYWGGNFSVVEELLKKNQLKETDIRFFLGYSNWGIDCLDNEISDNHWLISPKNDSVFNTLNNDWHAQIVEHYPELAYWINAPENPLYN